jgi:hypothetical protein
MLAAIFCWHRLFAVIFDFRHLQYLSLPLQRIVTNLPPMFHLTKVTLIAYYGGTLPKFSPSSDKACISIQTCLGRGSNPSKDVNLNIQNLYMAAPLYGTYTLRKEQAQMKDHQV